MDESNRSHTHVILSASEESGSSTTILPRVTKVNIDTDGHLVWMRVHREYLRDVPDGFDFRKPGEIYVKAYADFIAHKSEKLLSAGTLADVRAALGRG